MLARFPCSDGGNLGHDLRTRRVLETPTSRPGCIGKQVFAIELLGLSELAFALAVVVALVVSTATQTIAVALPKC